MGKRSLSNIQLYGLRFRFNDMFRQLQQVQQQHPPRHNSRVFRKRRHQHIGWNFRVCDAGKHCLRTEHSHRKCRRRW